MGLSNLFSKAVASATGTNINETVRTGTTNVTKSGTKTKVANSNIPQRCYIPEVRENGDIYHTLNTKLSLQRRRELSCQMPESLREPCLHEGPRMPNEWFHMEDGQLHFLKTVNGVYPYACWLDPLRIIEIRVLQRMVRMQELTLIPGFKQRLDSYLAAGERGSSHFEMGVSVSPGGGDFSIQLSGIARGGQHNKNGRVQDPEVLEFLEISAEVSGVVIDHIMPENIKSMVKRGNAVDASMSRGPLNNPGYTTSTQLNITVVGDKELGSLKKFGKLHIDGADDKMLWSVVFFLGHLHADTFPGRFCIPDLRLACLCAPFSILAFQGGHPHVSRGMGPYTVPKDSPLRYQPSPGLPRPDHDRYQRSVVINYPKKTLTRPSFLPQTEMLTDDALRAHWFTREALRTWEMCFYIMRNQKHLDPAPEQAKASRGGKHQTKSFAMVNGVEEELNFILTESYEPLIPEEVVKLFPWTDEETQTQCFPSIETAKLCLEWTGKTDEEWEKAQKITDACNGVFGPSAKVKKQRRAEKAAWIKKVELYQKLYDKQNTKYLEYEADGLVKRSLVLCLAESPLMGISLWTARLGSWC